MTWNITDLAKVVAISAAVFAVLRAVFGRPLVRNIVNAIAACPPRIGRKEAKLSRERPAARPQRKYKTGTPETATHAVRLPTTTKSTARR